MTTKFRIQDRVKIGRFESMGPLQGRVGEITGFANASEAIPYQRCNIRLDTPNGRGERVELVDSRVLTKVPG